MNSFPFTLRTTLLASGLTLLTLVSCQKSPDALTPPDTDTTTDLPNRGTVREKGTPISAAAEKMIGPEGGTLTSTDGKLTLTVPAGAVTKATNFSMQPVTNTLPLSPEQSFRLLPEGQTFEKPVTLQFHYEADSLKYTSAVLLYMAYQGSDGIWKFLSNTKLDETAQTLTVQSRHFSDWSVFAEFNLEPVKSELKPNESTEIHLNGPFFIPSLDNAATSENEIADIRPLDNPANIQNWQATTGTLKITANKQKSGYTAPAKVPAQNPAWVSVEVLNFIPPGVDPTITGRGKAIIKTPMYIVGDTYFECNGSLIQIYSTVLTGNKLMVTAKVDGSFLTFNIPGYTGEGAYHYGSPDKPASMIASMITPGSLSSYSSFYPSCEPGAGYINSSGNFRVIDADPESNTIAGYFDATLYYPEGICPYKLHTKGITGRFKLQITRY